MEACPTAGLVTLEEAFQKLESSHVIRVHNPEPMTFVQDHGRARG